MPLLGHTHDRARKLMGQHQRLVAGVIEIRESRHAVRDDCDAVRRLTPLIPSAQNRRAFAALEQPLHDPGNQRCLAGATDTQISDADNRAGKATARFGVPLEPPPPAMRDPSVKEIKQLV
jgi:hypothetical protein